MHVVGILAAAVVAVMSASGPAGANTVAEATTAADLSALSIEELANVEITSVSRRPEPLSQAPAAVFVITNDDVERSGAVSLPDALRLAPNLQVARVDSAEYAITARGFNHPGGTANKLQVLIDGRSVYTPLFSGVFWDTQNVMLADLDRIEVISGPGGTLWGSNAVNGVINVITRNSRDSQGWLVDAGYGDNDWRANVRYGGRVGDDLTFRVYGMAFGRSRTFDSAGVSAMDGSSAAQGGFRSDWRGAADEVSVEGGLYNGGSDEPAGSMAPSANRGGDVLASWRHRLANGGEFQAKAYYDRSRRLLSSGIDALSDIYDLDAQYNFSMGSRHAVVVGAGHRIEGDAFRPGPRTSFLSPADRTLLLSNLFAQDQIALASNLTLTAGLKAEHNTYTGWEWMPDARLAWRPSDRDLLWAAASRTVRTPSRVDRDLINPGILDGGPDFLSERLIAYEVGYRGQLSARASISVSAYYNVYDDLRSVEASGPAVFPLVIRNGLEGKTYGLEIWGSYAVADWWRLSAGLDALHKNIRIKSGVADVLGLSTSGDDPSYQVSVRSSMNLPGRLALDTDLRSVGKLSNSNIPAYVEMDARLAWKTTRHMELSVAGMNLLHALHPEFASGSGPPRQLPRSVYAAARWSF